MSGLFPFVQFEFGFILGPLDGRFMVRDTPEGDPQSILVIATLGAPERRRLRGRRGRAIEQADPEPVPTTRATVVRAQSLPDATEAEAWLEGLRASAERADAEVAAALAVLNRALHAHRVARTDPHARDVHASQALALRIGFGSGDAVAEGRFAAAWEPPGQRRRVRRSMEAPEERFAALLGARAPVLACEELVLRARSDLDAGRSREAALQARVALESLLAEIESIPGGRRGDLEADRRAVGDAANAALRGVLDPPTESALAEAVARMEAALRAWRLGAGAG